MARPPRPHRHSLLSQDVDRAAFVAYFLGAVVPLVALAVVLQRFALPALRDAAWEAALIGAALSIAALSGGAFVLLRRVTRQAVARMAADNQRLAALLATSEQLARAAHAVEVASRTAACAIEVTGAEAAWWIAAGEAGEPKVEAAAGDGARLERLRPALAQALAPALESGRPSLWAGGARGAGGAVVPIEGRRALVVAVASGALEPSQLGFLSTLAALAAVSGRNAELRDAQRNFFVHVTDMLVAAMDAHIDVPSGHARRVAQLANQLARELGLPDEVRQRLHFAALLHDVGMLRIHPQRHAEREAYRQHPTLAYRMLAPIQLWADIAPIVLHHHEWWDGRGYPEGIAGERIPPESRIIGIAEAFDSMTSASSYKPAVPLEEAVRRVEAGAGTQFDPAVVQAFLALAQRGELAAR
jgi:putative nucleotidyltransferase with HDIG domain